VLTFTVLLQNIADVVASEEKLNEALSEIDIVTSNAAVLDDEDVGNIADFFTKAAESATQVLKVPT